MTDQSLHRDLLVNRIRQAVGVSVVPAVMRAASKDVDVGSKRYMRGVAGLALIGALTANHIQGKELSRRYLETAEVKHKSLQNLADTSALEPIKVVSPLARVKELYALHKDRKMTKTAEDVPVIPATIFKTVDPNKTMFMAYMETPEYKKALKRHMIFIPKGDHAAARGKIDNLLYEKFMNSPDRHVQELPDKFKFKSLVGKRALVHNTMEGIDSISKSRIIGEKVFKIKNPLLSRSAILTKSVAAVKAQPSLIKKPMEAAVSLGEMAIEQPARLAAEIALLSGTAWLGKKIVDHIRAPKQEPFNMDPPSEEAEKTAEKDDSPRWVPVAIGASIGAGTAKASNKIISLMETASNKERKSRGQREIAIRRLHPLAAAALGAGAGIGLHALRHKLKLVSYKDK